MAVVQLNLKDNLKARVAARAAESGFNSIEAYVEALLRSDAGEDQAVVDDELEELLLRGLDSGPGVEFTPQFAEQFKQQVAKRRASNKAQP